MALLKPFCISTLLGLMSRLKALSYGNLLTEKMRTKGEFQLNHWYFIIFCLITQGAFVNPYNFARTGATIFNNR